MKRKLPTLFCVGTNHESAGLDFRETLFLEQADIDAALPQLIKLHDIEEIMVLSTCNRLEVYGVIDKSDLTSQHLREIFIDLQRLSPNKEKDLAEEIKNHSYQHTNVEAITHAFSVASGLNSLVLGETQITGQFKASAANAAETGRLGPILNRLTQEAFSTAKKIRTQTSISRRPVSISHAAIDLANRLYGHVSKHTVLIIGAGEMAEIAAKYALKYKPKELMIINRTFHRADKLVQSLGFGAAYLWEELADVLSKADIIISSTSSHEPIIDRAMVAKAQKSRANRPSFLIDIALPRDIDSRCSELDDVYLFDIDDLRQVVDSNVEERRKAAHNGFHIVEECALNFNKWLSSFDLKPALSEFRTYMEQLCEQEYQKSLGRSPLRSLGQEEQKALKRMLKSVMDKMCGDAGRAIQKSSEGMRQEVLAQALLTLFGPTTHPTAVEKDHSDAESNSQRSENRHSG